MRKIEKNHGFLGFPGGDLCGDLCGDLVIIKASAGIQNLQDDNGVVSVNSVDVGAGADHWTIYKAPNDKYIIESLFLHIFFLILGYF